MWRRHLETLSETNLWAFACYTTIDYNNGHVFLWDYLLNSLCKRLCCREKLSHMLQEEKEKSGKVEKFIVGNVFSWDYLFNSLCIKGCGAGRSSVTCWRRRRGAGRWRRQQSTTTIATCSYETTSWILSVKGCVLQGEAQSHAEGGGEEREGGEGNSLLQQLQRVLMRLPLEFSL